MHNCFCECNHRIEIFGNSCVTRLLLVVVEPTALGGVRGVAEPIARRDVVGVVGRRPAVILELDEPGTVFRIVQFFSHRAVPVESLFGADVAAWTLSVCFLWCV